MDCEKCQELLSDLLDGTLTSRDSALLTTHVEECLCCAGVRQDLQAIVSVARESREEFVSPPHERALWLRVRNIIEAELSANQVAVASVATTNQRESFWSRFFNKRWELSLPQLTAAVAALVVGVSLATALGLQSMQKGARQISPHSLNAAGVTNATSVSLNRFSQFNPAEYIRQQQMEIEYWRQRVEQRKARWNPRMREAFERNMGVVNQAVNDSLDELSRAPHDEISEEMLNSALRKQMELLKEFSDL